MVVSKDGLGWRLRAGGRGDIPQDERSYRMIVLGATSFRSDAHLHHIHNTCIARQGLHGLYGEPSSWSLRGTVRTWF